MGTLSVVESKVWLGLTQSRRQEISQYWNSFPADDPFADNYDTSFAVENMKKDSQFRQKAMRRGLIRPFLLLVSMSPKRRAAMAYLMGITLMNQIWYREFDPHHEKLLLRKQKVLLNRKKTKFSGLLLSL